MNKTEHSTSVPEGQTLAYTVDDIICDGYLINHLLDVTAGILNEMDFGGGATRNVELDRENALVVVGGKSLARIMANIEANYGSLIEGRAHA